MRVSEKRAIFKIYPLSGSTRASVQVVVDADAADDDPSGVRVHTHQSNELEQLKIAHRLKNESMAETVKLLDDDDVNLVRYLFGDQRSGRR